MSPNSSSSQFHQRTSSMHAHFFLDDTTKHQSPMATYAPAATPTTPIIRSRSGSIVANTNNPDFNLKPGFDISNISSQLGVIPTHVGDLNKVIIENRSNSNTSSIIQPLSSLNLSNSNNNNVNTNNTNTNNNNTNIPDIMTPSNVSARLQHDDGKLHILFGACGSISIKKTKLIINKLDEIYKDKVSIQLILTKSAENFISKNEFPNNIILWRDEDEWSTWNSRTDPVLHIELRKWADILIIAPLTANSLSKIALGLCDNLLTNVVRAWNSQYPILLAPAMVSFAYTSVITKRHVKVIKENMKWIEILKPTEKVMSSYGEIGMGGMMDWNEVVVMIVEKLGGYPEEEEDDDDDG
ncbi:Protein phosphatase 1 negative regulatory subunit, partial [Pichia californica]